MCGVDVNLALTGYISEENGCSAGTNSSTNSSKSFLRSLQWNEVPEPLRKEVLLMLSVSDTVKLDTAIAARQEREELVRAYKGLRSRGFDGHEHYTDADGYASLMWARERKIDLRNFRLEYKGMKEDQNAVLGHLVYDRKQDLATYFATRCDVRDTNIAIQSCVFFNSTERSSTIILATKLGYVEILQALLLRGADVNKENEYGWILLHHAAASGHWKVVSVLIEAGADFRRRDHAGWTPLQVASYAGHKEIVMLLLKAGAGGAELNKGNERGDTPLSWACRGGHVEVVRSLIKAGAEVNKSNRNGWTPLFEASIEGHIEVVHILLEAKADVKKCSNDGETPLHEVANGGRLPLIVAVMEAGTDMDMGNRLKRREGGASWKGRVKAARALISAGADVNKRDSYGRTPLSLALKLLPSDDEHFRREQVEVAAILRDAEGES